MEGTPYESIIFHIIIRLGFDYPMNPPVIELCTKLTHEHVHQQGKFICLDMVRKSYISNKKSWKIGVDLKNRKEFLKDGPQVPLMKLTLRLHHSIYFDSIAIFFYE
jgi:hypothetical protein